MNKRNHKIKEQKSKLEHHRKYKSRFKNTQFAEALNKHFGFPEDFNGKMEDMAEFGDALPTAVKVFNATKIEKVATNKG